MTERYEQLISMFLQNTFAMTEQQRHELSVWITQDTKNTREFIEASLFHRCIHNVLLGSDIERKRILHGDANFPEMSDKLFDQRLWEMLSKEEETAPEIEIQRVAAEQELIRNVKHEKIEYKSKKAALLTIITAVAAVFLFFLFVKYIPSTVKVEVATLTCTVNAQWAESAAPMGAALRLVTNHEPLMLRKGYAELVFDNHAKVVLEAPVEFQVLSQDQIKLTYGRLYATVPAGAMGFIVSTPSSKIIDLGTEFGVQTDFNGTTELHVVKGKTSLVSGPNDHKINILLNAGSARKIVENASAPIDIPCNAYMFARQIEPKNHFVWRGQNINLADIVSGGNGFGTGQFDKGIDPVTGNITQSLPRNDVYEGPKGYITVASNPYIDGVFVPGINPGPVQIASSGVKTEALPGTTGLIWGYIFNGAWHEGVDVPRHRLQLNGASLEVAQSPAITMHSNLGITFDLSAIRRALPGMRVKSLTSTFGVSNTVEKRIESRDFSGLESLPGLEKLAARRHASVEFWVFLDGKKVLQQTQTSASQAGIMDIPIDDNVRFLTLAVTEADDTFMYDWAVFAHPQLVLDSADNAPIIH